MNGSKSENKGRIAVRSRAFRPDAAAVPFNDMFADGKAKAGAGLSPVPLDLIEALKYALEVLLGDARAIVCYAKDDAVADLPGAHADAAHCAGEEAGVKKGQARLVA